MFNQNLNDSNSSSIESNITHLDKKVSCKRKLKNKLLIEQIKREKLVANDDENMMSLSYNDSPIESTSSRDELDDEQSYSDDEELYLNESNINVDDELEGSDELFNSKHQNEDYEANDDELAEEDHNNVHEEDFSQDLQSDKE